MGKTSEQPSEPTVVFEPYNPDKVICRGCGSVLKPHLAQRALCPFCGQRQDKGYPIPG